MIHSFTSHNYVFPYPTYNLLVIHFKIDVRHDSNSKTCMRIRLSANGIIQAQKINTVLSLNLEATNIIQI